MVFYMPFTGDKDVLSPHPSTGGLLPILSQMGPAAPSGIVITMFLV